MAGSPGQRLARRRRMAAATVKTDPKSRAEEGSGTVMLYWPITTVSSPLRVLTMRSQTTSDVTIG
jgi:hypothetical protein